MESTTRLRQDGARRLLAGWGPELRRQPTGSMKDDNRVSDSRFMQLSAAQSGAPRALATMGAREAGIAALKEYHSGFFEVLIGDMETTAAAVGQYMPVLNKDGSLHRGCRVYKIIQEDDNVA